MTNNDTLRRLRYTFDLSDQQMIDIFALAGKKVERAEVVNWLKKDDDPYFKSIYDKDLAYFLNGFIILKRGKREGPLPIAEKTLSNNLVMKKLKIALNLKTEDIIDILDLANLRVGKHEITALFRKPTQSQFRLCKDQFLRNFLHGLQIRYKQD